MENEIYISPFHLFPLEVWEALLEQLKCPQDKLNLLRSHPELEKVFHESKAKLLFDGLLPIILKRNEDNWTLKTTFLSCRLISKLFCKTVDEFIQKEFKSLGWLPPHFARSETGVFLNPENITRFLNAMENHPPGRSPILGRYIGVACSSADNERYACSTEDVMRMLRRTGSYLEGVFLKTAIAQGEELSQFLNNALSTLPNLKFLDLYLPIIPQNLQPEPAAAEFPDLSELEGLSICGSSRSHLVLFTLLRKYFLQLKFFSLDIRLWRKLNNNIKELFPNLVYLELSFIQIFNQEHYNHVFEWLRKLSLPKTLKIIQFYVEVHHVQMEAANDMVSLWRKEIQKLLEKKFPKKKCKSVAGQWEAFEEGAFHNGHRYRLVSFCFYDNHNRSMKQQVKFLFNRLRMLMRDFVMSLRRTWTAGRRRGIRMQQN